MSSDSPLLPIQAHYPEEMNPGYCEDCPSVSSLPSPTASPEETMSRRPLSDQENSQLLLPSSRWSEVNSILKKELFLLQSYKDYGQMRVWLPPVDYFREQDASKETIHKVSVYLVGLRQAERKVWVLCKKQGSEIQTSDKATMKRFPAVGSAGCLCLHCHRPAG